VGQWKDIHPNSVTASPLIPHNEALLFESLENIGAGALGDFEAMANLSVRQTAPLAPDHSQHCQSAFQ
jgi:hypothetical protein